MIYGTSHKNPNTNLEKCIQINFLKTLKIQMHFCFLDIYTTFTITAS